MLGLEKIQSTDRRNDDRVSCRTPVRIYADDGPQPDSFVLDSADVSSGGVFLQTDLLFPVGEWLDLELATADRTRPVRCRGRVVRVVADRPATGVAVRLHDLTDEERWALSRLNSDFVCQAGAIVEDL